MEQDTIVPQILFYKNKINKKQKSKDQCNAMAATGYGNEYNYTLVAFSVKSSARKDSST